MGLRTEKNNITETIENTFRNLNGLIDVNTVVGKPLKSDDGQLIIPVSKVTVGVLAGGGEYGKLGIFNKNENFPFTAGNGAVISIKPCGFLVKEDEKFRILSVSENSYEKLIEKTQDIISDLTKEKAYDNN